MCWMFTWRGAQPLKSVDQTTTVEPKDVNMDFSPPSFSAPLYYSLSLPPLPQALSSLPSLLLNDISVMTLWAPASMPSLSHCAPHAGPARHAQSPPLYIGPLNANNGNSARFRRYASSIFRAAPFCWLSQRWSCRLPKGFNGHTRRRRAGRPAWGLGFCFEVG